MTPQLDEHQIIGGRWLAQRERAGLFDPMGLGKTATAIHAMDLTGAERGIIITTATTKENWKREIKRWSTRTRKIIKGNDIYDLASWAKGYWDIIIFSYAMAKPWGPRITSNVPYVDFLICDEAHALKTMDSDRTIAVRGPRSDGCMGIAQLACNTWELTGTPIPNDPADLYCFLRFTKATTLEQHVFVNLYFYKPDEKKNRYKARPEKIAELRQMIQSVSLRRDIDVVNQPLRITQSFIDGDARAVTQFLKDHPGLDAVILQALEDGDLANLGSYGEHVATVRRLLGEAKALPFAHYLADQIDGGLKKCVVFGVHIHALRMVREHLAKRKIRCVYLDGSVSQNARQRAIDEFQDDPKCTVFCANIQAGGEGITLHSADRAFMFESGWTPKDNSQPIKRIHRRGQTRPCNAEFVTLANSFDEHIIDVVRQKVQAIFEVTNELMLAAPQ